jgi:hypothetical protein
MKKYNTAELKFDQDIARLLKYDIIGEIISAIRWPDTLVRRAVITALVSLPTQRFAEVMADFDRVILESGLRCACEHLLNKLVTEVDSSGAEEIPEKGPVIIAANHPGTFDSLSILSQLPREDAKIIVGANPFFYDMRKGRDFLIFSPRQHDKRFEVIRQAIQHLQNGGLLLIFPYGHIAPDPAILDEASACIREWSRSLGIFLRKVPEAQLILTVISGVITREYLRHPLPNMFSGFERRRIIEFMQMIKQMIFHQTKDLCPKVSFKREEFHGSQRDFDIETRMETIISQELDLLNVHMKTFYPTISPLV